MEAVVVWYGYFLELPIGERTYIVFNLQSRFEGKLEGKF